MWTRTEKETPVDGEVVVTLSEGGQETELKYHAGLWWFPDMSMYVYYVPVLWKRHGS